MNLTKQDFQLANVAIQLGSFSVDQMYVKSGALRGAAILELVSDTIEVHFEFDMPEPPEAKVHLLMLMDHVRAHLCKAVTEAFHIMAFIDFDTGGPTPLAAEFPDLSRPVIERMQPFAPTPPPTPGPRMITLLSFCNLPPDPQ